MIFGQYDLAAFITFSAYAAGSVVLPVALVSLSRDMGFSLDEGGMTRGGALHLGRTLLMLVSMLLCGFIAARWGKRRTMGAAVAVMSLGILLCAAAPFYGVMFVALMIAGLGEGVIEGLATPFVEALHPDEPGRYINFAHAFWSVGVFVTVLVTGGLISLGVPWRVLVASAAVVALVAVVFLLLPRRSGEPYPDHPEAIHWRVVWANTQLILRHARFWTCFVAMFLAGGGEFCLTFWCASYIQLSFLDAAWAGGVGTACFALGMFLGRTGWGYAIHQKHLNRLIFWSALAGAMVTCLFPLLTSLWLFFGLLIVAGFAVAPFWPSIQSYCADRMPGHDSTMVFILLSCAGIPGCGVFAWLMGYLGDWAGGLRTAFWVVPVCFLLLALLIGLDGLHRQGVQADSSEAAGG